MSLFDHSRFYLLRHGQTAQNAADLIAGATDVPLTDLGRAQAHRAAEGMRGLPIGRLFASPLQRAWQTAEAIAALRPDMRIEPAPLLAERHWGVWEGAPRAILDRDATPEGGESPRAFHDRILSGCVAISGPEPHEDPPLVVAHSGTLRAVMAALGLPFLRPSNCARINIYRDRRGRWRADSPVVARHPVPQPSPPEPRL